MSDNVEMDQINEDADQSFEFTVGRFLTYRLSRVQARMNAQGARILQNAAGLSLIQWRIITLVAGHDGATSTELTAVSAIDKGLFSRKLKTLVLDGIIQAKVNPADNRVQHLFLTDKGREIHARVLPIMMRRQEVLREGLGPEKADQLFDLLVEVENILENWTGP